MCILVSTLRKVPISSNNLLVLTIFIFTVGTVNLTAMTMSYLLGYTLRLRFH